MVRSLFSNVQRGAILLRQIVIGNSSRAIECNESQTSGERYQQEKHNGDLKYPTQRVRVNHQCRLATVGIWLQSVFAYWPPILLFIGELLHLSSWHETCCYSSCLNKREGTPCLRLPNHEVWSGLSIPPCGSASMVARLAFSHSA